MSRRQALLRALLAATALSPGACAALSERRSAAATEPIAMQVAATERELQGLPLRVLLSFEAPEDRTFIVTDPAGSAGIDAGMAHTGEASLVLSPRTRALALRLDQLMAGRLFPGSWSLIGAYFRCEYRREVTVSYQAQGRTLAGRTETVLPGRWTAVLLDVSALEDPNVPPAPPGVLRFEIQPAHGRIWCDDILLVGSR
jgi:hypothetical protein